jgi:hypothetical protein
MSIFGKILAVFNVFAVVGALALMAMVYAKRQAWEYAVFRQDLMIGGLPLDDKETDAQEDLAKDKIGEKTQQDLFKQVSPTTPVATQEAEVERVRNELRNQFQNAGDKKKQIYILARILAPMAVTFEQRQQAIAYETYLRDDKTFADLVTRLKNADEAAVKVVKGPPLGGRAVPYDEAFHDALNAVFSNPPGPLGEEFLTVKKADPAATTENALDRALDNQLTQMKARFEQLFDDAKSGGENIKGGASSQRKRAIARLLFNMVEVLSNGVPGGGNAQPDLVNNPAYKRFVVVVGVQAALEAVNEQAGIYQDIVAEVDLERERERGLFVMEHRKVIDLARDKKAQVEAHTLLLARKKSEIETHETALLKRRLDVASYQEHLATARAKTSARLQQLRKLSDALFHERVELHKNSLDNQKLEKDIRSLEAEIR